MDEGGVRGVGVGRLGGWEVGKGWRLRMLGFRSWMCGLTVQYDMVQEGTVLVGRLSVGCTFWCVW